MLFQKEKVKKEQIDRCENIHTQKAQTKNHQMNNKKERERSLKYRFFLFPPMNRKELSGKVSFGISLKCLKKASLAVETALVLPLFFLGMVTIISFMDLYKLQTEHLTKLCQTAKEAGMYAYVLDGKGPDELAFPDVYTYKPIGGLIPLPKIWTYNQVKVHTWTGVEYEGEQEDVQGEPMVYVTESGTVYHKSLSCSYINLSVNQVSGGQIAGMRNDYGERYVSCEICSRNQNPAGVVYVTKKGNRYHNLESCSGLKRTVRMIKEAEASQSMGACGRCG